MNRVREVRISQGLSLRQLASRAGLSKSLISAVERGLQRPGIRAIQALSKALVTPAADLFPDLFPIPSIPPDADNAKSA